MTREQALNYLRSIGFSEEQIQTLVEALTDKDAVSRKTVLSVVKSPRSQQQMINMIEGLPPVTPANRWIPVSERLPEKSGMYIVTDKVFSLVDSEHTGRFKRMTEQVEFCNGKWQRATRFYEIVAWMPLPEPYKGESE